MHIPCTAAQCRWWQSSRSGQRTRDLCSAKYVFLPLSGPRSLDSQFREFYIIFPPRLTQGWKNFYLAGLPQFCMFYSASSITRDSSTTSVSQPRLPQTVLTLRVMKIPAQSTCLRSSVGAQRHQEVWASPAWPCSTLYFTAEQTIFALVPALKICFQEKKVGVGDICKVLHAKSIQLNHLGL